MPVPLQCQRFRSSSLQEDSEGSLFLGFHQGFSVPRKRHLMNLIDGGELVISNSNYI